MKRISKQAQSLLAVGILLFSAALACSVDLGLEDKPDETAIAKDVEASLTAVIATEGSSQTETALAVPTDTPAPTFTSTLPPTETLIPTDTLTPTPEGVTISPILFAAKVDDANKPINPADSFKQGTTKIFGTYSYSGIKKGMKVVFRWDNNGKEFNTITRDWSYSESGDSWVNVYWTEGGGLPKGNWKLSIYVEGELVQSGSCVIY